MMKKQPTFEQALVQLESIVKQLEGGALSLEESLALFERGVKLSAYCSGVLDQAEQKVTVLIKGGDGEIVDPDQSDAGPAGQDENPAAAADQNSRGQAEDTKEKQDPAEKQDLALNQEPSEQADQLSLEE